MTSSRLAQVGDMMLRGENKIARSKLSIEFKEGMSERLMTAA
jgi:hypothetical protein